MTINDMLYVVRIQMNLDFGLVVEAGLELLNKQFIVVTHVDDDITQMEAYHGDRATAEDQKKRLDVFIIRKWAKNDPWGRSVICVPNHDWQEKYRSFFT